MRNIASVTTAGVNATSTGEIAAASWPLLPGSNTQSSTPTAGQAHQYHRHQDQKPDLHSDQAEQDGNRKNQGHRVIARANTGRP